MKKNPVTACALSLVPGCGHYYLGKKPKGISLTMVFVLITISFLLTDSVLVKMLMLFVYLALVFPAVIESYVLAKDADHPGIFSKPYVICMLMTTGMSAFPLLWESGHFSKKEKVIWTVVVIALAALFFIFLVGYWEQLDSYASQFFKK